MVRLHSPDSIRLAYRRIFFVYSDLNIYRLRSINVILSVIVTLDTKITVTIMINVILHMFYNEKNL